MTTETTQTKGPGISDETFILILAELSQEHRNLLEYSARRLSRVPWVEAGASSPEDYEQNREAYAERLAEAHKRHG